MATNFSNASSSPQNMTCDFRYNPFPVKIVNIILNSIIMLSGLVGNALLIKVVHKRKELRNTVNYFIVNMAVSDFVYPLLQIPIHLSQIASSSWQWRIAGTAGLAFCKLSTFLRDVSITVSVQSLVWIASDRFVAVALLMKVHLISGGFPVLAITSTWVVAIAGNCLTLYITGLIREKEEIVCTNRQNTVFLQLLPLVTMTILYCAIAMALRRQDKALQCRAVHQKDQRKRRAIKISSCVMAAFYICFLPGLFANLIWQYNIAESCSLLKVLWLLAIALVCFSSTINPVICMAFVQSFHRKFIKIASSCCSKPLTTYNTNNKEKWEREKVTLQKIRITAAMDENFARRKSEETQNETRFKSC